MSSATALVTGADGFIGRHVVEALQAHGWSVRAVVRKPPLGPVGFEPIVIPDIVDRDAIRRGLQGVTAVVHLAGRAHVPDRTSAAREEFDRVNVIGVQVVAEEAVRAGVLRLVGISSIAAVAHASATPLTENAIPHPQSAYGRSKLAGEAALKAATAGTRTAFIVLRPPLVYGPGMRGNPLRLFELVRRGLPLPIGGHTNRRSVLYVGNLAAAILRVLEHDQAANQIFHVADDAVLSTAEFANQVGEALGRPARLLRLPAPFLRGLGWIGDAAGRVLPELLPISSAQIDGLLESLEMDTSRLRERCGFVPPFSLSTAIKVTAAWFSASRDTADGGLLESR